MPPLVHKGISAFRKNVRIGFLIAMVAVTTVLGSSLYATIAMMPYYQLRPPQGGFPSLAPELAARLGVPTELAWFFVQYAYLSSDVTIKPKNLHTFVVNDNVRDRSYVITVGQNFRRVEIYFGNEKDRTTVHIFSPGKKRVVDMRDDFIVKDETLDDANLWMWQSPLWNRQHLKIYALADFWLDSPYKKFSCAGFVHRYLGDAGIRVPILDAWDMAKLPWTRVPVDEMEPGDIITIRAASPAHRRFWNHTITHVGVYLGNGKLIHASTASRKAKRSFIRVANLEQFHGRVDKILRPPDLL